MSAKRCLLIALALWGVALSAQVSAWTYSSVYHAKTLYKEHLTGYDVNKVVNARMGNFNLELDNRFEYYDRVRDDRQERVNDRLQLTLANQGRDYYAKAFYRLEYNDKAYGWIMPMGQPMPHYERNSSQVGFSGAVNLGKFDAELQARYRSYQYTPVFSFMPDELKGNNLKAESEIDYHISKPLAVFVKGFIKADDDEPDFDYQSAGLGIKLSLPITPIQHLQAQSQVCWLDGEYFNTNATDRMIPITHAVRYAQMVTPQLMGYASYENRSFYDRAEQAWLLNSHFLRTSAKYTLDYDLAHASYIELGTKLSPHKKVTRKSSAIFTHAETKVIGKLYLGAGINHLDERLTRYNGVIRYFVTPVSEVFIDYTYTDDVEYKDYTTYTSGGIRMVF
jgi:hypothetical protein